MSNLDRKVPLSKRVRADCEAAEWVIREIVILEDRLNDYMENSRRQTKRITKLIRLLDKELGNEQ